MNMLEKKLVSSVDAVRICPGAMKTARELLPKWKKEVFGSGPGSRSRSDGFAADSSRLISNNGVGSSIISRIRDLWRL